MDALRREKIINAIYVILNDCSLRNHHMLYDDAIAILKDYERDYGLAKKLKNKIERFSVKHNVSREEAFEIIMDGGIGPAGLPMYEYDENDIFAMEVISAVLKCLDHGYLSNRSGKHYKKNEKSKDWERSRASFLKGVSDATK